MFFFPATTRVSFFTVSVVCYFFLNQRIGEIDKASTWVKMSLYYSGFNGGSCIFPREISIETFTRVPFTDIKDFAIGWNYFLMIGMTGKELFISGKLSTKDNGQIRPLNLPDLLRHR